MADSTATSLAIVHEAPSNDIDVQTYLSEHRAALREELHDGGALLLRGFRVGGAAGLDGAVRAFSGSAPLTYLERSSPRSTIQGEVYTSTDYPADQEILLHNESSYQVSWPRLLFFHCMQPPRTQGATPLADVREVYRNLDLSVRQEFERRGWQLVRNFQERFGVAWPATFGTDDRRDVERYCDSHGLEWQWRPDGGLRTRAVRAVARRHPVTDEWVWFNHATFFHITSLPPEIQDGMRELFAEEDLPTNTYYGDGGRIPSDVLDHLRTTYRAAATRFDWRYDDVLIVDNMLTAHARESYTGPRRIAVAMAEPSDAS
ncbi:TauD/TfdA family dioxygenase [Micromonospora sp. NPDC005215]|uniref:TauD/TfdA family dioxygenase n=1 Tax=Micromonospora sp. NPDC005215 TaxID=3157024 RepID=UPI0033B77E2C